MATHKEKYIRNDAAKLHISLCILFACFEREWWNNNNHDDNENGINHAEALLWYNTAQWQE